jgi:hypothetical protein
VRPLGGAAFCRWRPGPVALSAQEFTVKASKILRFRKPVTSGASWAQDNDGCTNATLNGDYAFAVSALHLTSGQPPTPQVVVGIVRYDGKGNRTQIDYIGDSLRTRNTTDFAMGETGTYTVNPDCTGREQVQLNVPNVPPGTSHGVIDSVFVIAGGGRSIHAVVARFTPPGATTTRVHPDSCRFLEGRVGAGQLNGVSHRRLSL